MPGGGAHSGYENCSADIGANGGRSGGECGLQLQKLSYVIGISDNGGSTSEILRVFGGPGIGDVRSRSRLTLDTHTKEGVTIWRCGHLYYNMSRFVTVGVLGGFSVNKMGC